MEDQMRLTFFAYEQLNVVVPPKHDAEHLLAKLVGRFSGPWLRHPEWNIVKSGLGEGEKILAGLATVVRIAQQFFP